MFQALDKIRFLSLTDKEILGEGDDAKLEIQVCSYGVIICSKLPITVREAYIRSLLCYYIEIGLIKIWKKNILIYCARLSDEDFQFERFFTIYLVLNSWELNSNVEVHMWKYAYTFIP